MIDKTILKQYFVDTLNSLITDSSKSKLNNHTTVKGGNRETILLKFLKDSLPSLINIDRSVEILDSKNNLSKEVDICITSGVSPRIPLNGNNTIVFNDHVVCAIEVKSSLNAKELDDIIKKSKITKSLHRNKRFKVERIVKGLGETEVTQTSTIFLAFAFNGISSSNLIKLIQKININELDQLPDIIFNANKKYILIKNDMWLLPFDNEVGMNNYILIEGDEILVCLFQYIYLLCEASIYDYTEGYMDIAKYLE